MTVSGRDEPVEGAPSHGDPEVHLHSELGEEAKRLATHPREEAHRLSEELKAGEVETRHLPREDERKPEGCARGDCAS